MYCLTLAGEIICKAACTHRGGFNNADDAQKHNRTRNSFKKTARELEKKQVMLTASEARSRALPTPEPQAPQPGKVVTGFFGTANGIENLPEVGAQDIRVGLSEEHENNLKNFLEHQKEQMRFAV